MTSERKGGRRQCGALAALAAAGWLAGCGGGSEPEGPPTCEIGTGARDFAPLLPEQELPLVFGPQGGYHFEAHVRVRGILTGNPRRFEDRDNPITTLAAFREDGQQVDMKLPSYRIGYTATADGWYSLPGGRQLRLENAHAPGLPGQRIRLRVDVRDRAGTAVSDERWIVATAR